MNVLQEMTKNTPTQLWCDSCDPREVGEALGWGATGVTSNPPLVLAAVKKQAEKWRNRAVELAATDATATEVDIAWQILEEASCATAKLLVPAFGDSGGEGGRMSVQVDPKLYRDADAMADQAERLSQLAPNIIVKIPATEAGVRAVEEATYRGVSILGTVLYTVSQALALAEAVERGLARREEEGLDNSDIHPRCAIMVGRLDDWLKAVVARDGMMLDPGHLEWAGVAVFKRAYELFEERGYRTRLLSAAFRNHMHWSQFIGGQVVVSPPFGWQQNYIASDLTVEDRMGLPVDAAALEGLAKVEDFLRAYEPDGMEPAEFDGFGATARTLRQFLGAMADLQSFVRDAILPEPIGK